MNAALFYGGADDLAEQRFRDETGFGMTTGCRRQRASVATNEMFAFAFFKEIGRASCRERV